MNILISYLLIINIITFLLFGYEKNKLSKKKYKINNKIDVYKLLLRRKRYTNLILRCIVSGGFLGSILGMKLFKHRDKEFWYISFASIILWIILLYWM